MRDVKYVKVEKLENIVQVTIDRPPVNALNSEVFAEIKETFSDLAKDATIRAAVLTGAGEKAFVAGADIKEFVEFSKVGKVKELSVGGQDAFNVLEQAGFPIIAAIQGFCFGGGNELAMACDLRIAGESAKFSQPEINLGLIPGAAGTQRLTRLIGKTAAKQMLYFGEPIDAAEAYRLGLVNKVVPDAELLDQALAWARKLATKAPVALKLIKKAINEGIDLPLSQGQVLEQDCFDEVFKTEDVMEGITAFFEKRKPSFQGK